MARGREFIGPEVVCHVESDIDEEMLDLVRRELVTILGPRAGVAPLVSVVLDATEASSLAILDEADADVRETRAEVGLSR